MKKGEIIIYTDGSSLGNPGPGGFGAVIILGEKVIELGGRENESTNNRMEMMAAIVALQEIEKRKMKAKKILVHTDSGYLLNGITVWIHGWVKNNWRTASKQKVLNQDLWEILFKLENNLKKKSEIEWVKVKGHDGVALNERCDELATSFSAGEHVLLFTGNFKDYQKLFNLNIFF